MAKLVYLGTTNLGDKEYLVKDEGMETPRDALYLFLNRLDKCPKRTLGYSPSNGILKTTCIG